MCRLDDIRESYNGTLKIYALWNRIDERPINKKGKKRSKKFWRRAAFRAFNILTFYSQTYTGPNWY